MAPIAPGTGTPTGSVDFYDQSTHTDLGSQNLSGVRRQCNRAGALRREPCDHGHLHQRLGRFPRQQHHRRAELDHCHRGGKRHDGLHRRWRARRPTPSSILPRAWRWTPPATCSSPTRQQPHPRGPHAAIITTVAGNGTAGLQRRRRTGDRRRIQRARAWRWTPPATCSSPTPQHRDPRGQRPDGKSPPSPATAPPVTPATAGRPPPPNSAIPLA